MTVGELIKELNKFNEDEIIILSDEVDGCTTEIALSIITNARVFCKGDYLNLEKAIVIETIN